MIIKSYEVKNTKTNLLKNNFFLLYGENLGLKKDIKNFILDEIKKKNKDLEVISLFENEILNNENRILSVDNGYLEMSNIQIFNNTTTGELFRFHPNFNTSIKVIKGT